LQIQQALSHAISQLGASESPHLDAELLLAHVLGKPREFLVTWPETLIQEPDQQAFLNLLQNRVLGHPIAYLIGTKAFWNFDLIVTTDVLVPRPETELLVEVMLEQLDFNKHLIADLGTGSGAIALALASERPQWQIVATDISKAALTVAEKNAENLHLQNIIFNQGSWVAALGDDQFDAIVSNPPYIDKSDIHLNQGDVRFEPQQALVAEDQGLADLKQIAVAALDKLKPGAILLMEHGYQQGEAVRQLLKQSGYNAIESYKDIAGLERATLARKY
jgi:release factor glutamine methyltransferase